ncbi:unnamed protein product [Moneuplotes crassus]|uniref:Uncharacterized protein n=1 Tax=Euplotes crassus TaxID=5936 RepID=A0AAD2D1J8_EUPCR|nr:unnamed protein product [Moneuplotes crassus]
MGDYFLLEILSGIVGWMYFVLWSLTFYPQASLNWSKKSVAGFSIDFAILNVSGYMFYSLFNWGGYIYSGLGTGIVQTNDLFFSVHGLLLASAHLSQVFIYKRGHQKHFKRWSLITLAILWGCVSLVFLLEGIILQYHPSHSFLGISKIPIDLNTLRMAGYGKAVITFLKYCPQIYLNWRRKSTEGYSIMNVLCDFSGGVLSLFQLVIDMIFNGLTKGEWSLLGSNTSAFNFIKFLLGIITIIFNIIFIIQHYLLYPSKRNDPLTLELISSTDRRMVK